MSADNCLLINKKTFEVKMTQGEESYEEGYLIGTGKSLEEAVDIAQKYEEEEIVEYGIHFIN